MYYIVYRYLLARPASAALTRGILREQGWPSDPFAALEDELMRFSVIAAGAAAILAVPVTLAVAGPQLSQDEFISAVRCVAIEDVSGADQGLGAAKWRLNVEAARQPEATVAAARAEVSAIAAGEVAVPPQMCEGS